VKRLLKFEHELLGDWNLGVWLKMCGITAAVFAAGALWIAFVLPTPQ